MSDTQEHSQDTIRGLHFFEPTPLDLRQDQALDWCLDVAKRELIQSYHARRPIHQHNLFRLFDRQLSNAANPSNMDWKTVANLKQNGHRILATLASQQHSESVDAP